MKSRKLLALAVLPLALLMVTPLSTHAQSDTYYLYVSCYSTSHYSDVSTLVFLGHALVVTCPAGYGFNSKEVSFPAVIPGTFYAQLIAGGQYQFGFGTFGPSSCGVDAVQYGPGWSSWAYFDIYTSYCAE